MTHLSKKIGFLKEDDTNKMIETAKCRKIQEIESA